jgi:hypothetical protein
MHCRNKKYYHTLRLLNEAKRIVAFEEPKVWIEGEERDLLMQVRAGEKDEASLLKQIEELRKDIHLYFCHYNCI